MVRAFVSFIELLYLMNIRGLMHCRSVCFTEGAFTDGFIRQLSYLVQWNLVLRLYVRIKRALRNKVTRVNPDRCINTQLNSGKETTSWQSQVWRGLD